MIINRRTFLAATGAAMTFGPGLGMAYGQSAEPKRGGTLVVHALSEQRTLNPALRAAVGVYLLGSKIVEPLADLDAAGNIVPCLATSWTGDDAGKSIVVKLRDGVTWHDGTQFTSKDVRFTALECWKKILNYGNVLHHALLDVETPDKSTAIFRYSEPMPMELFARSLTDLGHIIPAHLYEGTDIANNPLNTAPVGTGPFKFVEYVRGQHMIVARNENYWRKGLPYLDQIVWRFLPDPAVAAAALESEELHISPFSQLSMSDIARLSQDDRFVVGSQGYESNNVSLMLTMNNRLPELSDERVRHALAHAIDGDFVVENILYGFGKKARGPIPPSSTAFFRPDNAEYPFDLEKSKALLDAAGFTTDGRKPRFTVKMMPAPWGEVPMNFGQYVKQALAEVNVNVDIVQADGANYLSSVYNSHDFGLGVDQAVYRADPAISTTVWYRSGQTAGTPWSNQWGYKNSEVDAMIDQAARELDPAKRAALYGDMAKQANSDLPVYPVIDQSYISVTNKRVMNSHNTARWASSSFADTWLA